MKRYIRWISKNYFRLISIPLTLITVIIGIYGHAFDQELRSKSDRGNWHNLEYFIDFFNTHVYKGVDELTAKGVRLDKSPERKYNHLIILDRTASTINPAIGNRIKSFNERLVDSLRKDFGKTVISFDQQSDTKKLIVHRIYQEIIHAQNCQNLKFLFYDGDKQGLKPYTYDSQTGVSEWRPCTNEANRRDYIELLCQKNIYFKSPNQATDFSEVFSDVSKNDTSNLVLTIISDFDHELSNLSEDDIEKLQYGSDSLVQFNIIYIPTSDHSKRKRSNQLVKLLREKFEYVFNYTEINIEDNIDEDFNNQQYELFNNKVNQSFSTVLVDSSQINFYYPNDDVMGYVTAYSHLKDSSGYNKRILQWRISPSLPTGNDYFFFGKYRAKDKKVFTRFKLNNWYSFPKNSQLGVVLSNLSNIQNGAYCFEITDGYYIKRYNIDFVQFIPVPIASLGTYSIYFLFFLFIIALFVNIYTSVKGLGKDFYSSKLKYWGYFTVRCFLALTNLFVFLIFFRGIHDYINILCIILLFVHITFLFAYGFFRLIIVKSLPTSL